MQGFETLEFALTTDGGFDLGALASGVDDISTTPAIAMFVLFLRGVFFGLVITTIVVDLFLSRPREAHVTSFVGALWIGWAVPRAADRVEPIRGPRSRRLRSASACRISPRL